MGDFVGGLVKYLRQHPIPKLTLAGGFAKFTKLAQGAIDLHSARSQVDFETLADWGASCGMKAEPIRHANSALEVLQSASEEQRQALCEHIAKQAYHKIKTLLKDADVQVEIILVSREGALLTRYEG